MTRALCATLTCAAMLAACRSGNFVPPPASAPHAQLDYVFVYHRAFGQSVDQHLDVDGDRIIGPKERAAEWAGQQRVAPGRHRFDFTARFLHSNLRPSGITPGVTTTRAAPMPTCVSPTGTALLPSQCGSSVSASNPVLVGVVDAQCSQQLTTTVEAGERLRFEFYFEGNQLCELSCQRWRTPDAAPEPCSN